MNKIRIVRREGGSRVMTVSEIIPKGWEAVETEVSKQSKSSVTVVITKVK